MDTDEAMAAIHAVANPACAGRDTARRFDRRLSDKVLAAFIHAYAAGDRDVAERLREILVDLVGVERDDHPERRGGCPLERADLWMFYVDARDRFRAACLTDAPASTEHAAALDAMKASYQRWSLA